MENPPEIKKGLVSLRPGQPMQIEQVDGAPEETPSADQRALLDAVCDSILAYTKAAKEFLKGKYSYIRDYVPAHLKEPGLIACMCCTDGIVIRYDVKTTEEKPHLCGGWVNESLSDFAPKISESVVYFHPSKDYRSIIPDKGPEVSLTVTEGTTGKQTTIFHARIGFHCVSQDPSGNLPKPPAKPYCVVSIINSFELVLTGLVESTADNTKKPQNFLLRQPMRMPVGWECIEIFPDPDIALWKPEYAIVWAERDLLAWVVADQYKKQQLLNLDPKATARAEFTKLLKTYKQLLDSKPEREEALQSFLKENPALLCPAHTMMKPKLPFGKRISDFVFREATGDYLIVELEPSIEGLFTKSGNTNSRLNEARDQILDWRRYIEDNLTTVQKELDLPGISSNPLSLIVMGRASMLTPENRRKLVALENESPRTKIITYDDVFDNAKTIIENLLGPLWIEGPTPEVYYFPS
jgi:hypothetical protein